MPPFTSGLLQRRHFFWQKNTPCKVNKQLSDKGMKFVQTTSDGGKVRMAFEEISGRLCGKLLPFWTLKIASKKLRIFPFPGLLWSGRRWCQLLRGLADNLHFFGWVWEKNTMFWIAKLGMDVYYRCNYLNTQELYEFMLYKSMIACNIRINDGYMYSQKVDFFAPPKMDSWDSRVEIQGGDIYIYIYIYLEPKWPLFWMERAEPFGGFKPQNRGHLQVPGIRFYNTYFVESFELYGTLRCCWRL